MVIRQLEHRGPEPRPRGDRGDRGQDRQRRVVRALAETFVDVSAWTACRLAHTDSYPSRSLSRVMSKRFSMLSCAFQVSLIL